MAFATSRAHCSVSSPITGIIKRCAPAQVYQVIVFRIAIEVATLKTVRTLTDESLKNESMHI